MKKILPLLLGLFTLAAYAAENAAPAASTAPQPNDQASVAYMQAAQMGKVAVPGAPGNGRYFPPVPADPSLPTLWLIGDSTVRNGTLGDGTNMGQWGWGAPLTYYFDVKKINVVNRAFGGTSAISFYNGFFWKNTLAQIKQGDYVILQFGANDNGGVDLSGTGDETQGDKHTFGWYLKQFVKETREKGATCIICSLTPRKKWAGDKLSESNPHADWAAQSAKEIDAPYIDLHELIQRKYSELGKDEVDQLYTPSPTENLHTGWNGAVVNAERVVSGIEALKGVPLASFLNSRGKAIPPAPADLVAVNAEPGRKAEAAAAK